MAQFRGHETPMEFEFQNKTGPVDPRSPFALVGQNVQRLPSNQTPSKRRPNTSYESPSRALQSSPNKPLPSVPAFNSLYNTPRQTKNEMDDSSAGETPQSRAADSDATPDNVGYRSALSKFDNMSLPALAKPTRPPSSPSKEKERPSTSSSNSARRESIFGKLKSKLYSPGRGEVPRADYSQAMEKRVRKRRERELHRHVARRRRHSMSDSGDDSEQRPKRGSGSPRKTSGRGGGGGTKKGADDSDDSDVNAAAAPRVSSVASFFTFIAQHPTVPHILSFYAQLCFNIFLLAGCAWMIYCFWAAVQGDVDKKSHEAMADIAAEILECAQHYQANRCDPAVRLPALATVCENWSKCMNRDPARVGRAKVSAHTFAEIFNSFVEPISYKAMIFTFILVFGCFAISNFAFGFFRDKAASAQYAPAYYGPPPPTPQRSFSGQDAGGNFYGTPWHQQALSPHQGLEPQPSGGFPQIEGRGSPVRRLVYN